MSELSKTGSSVTGVVKTLLLLAACVCLYSIWALDLLPFQDYASHLFQVEVLAHPDRFPAAVFETHFTVGPYSGFYLLMRGLATVMPVELAGRIFLSLYVALVAALAWRVQRVSGAAISGGAALLIPAAMNQQYVLGNTNFYFAIPLAIFALLDFDELLDANWNRLGLVRQGVWQLLVLLFHPLVFLAVVGLTGASVLLKAARERRATSLMAFPAIGLIVYFITASGAAAGGGWYWMPLSRTLTYLGIFFSDLRIPRDPLSILSIVGWVSVAGIAALSIRSSGLSPRARRWLIHAGLTLLAVLVLPFGKEPSWTFVNMRLSAHLYFVLAVLVALIPMRSSHAIGVAVLALALTTGLVATQVRLGRELAPLGPLLKEIPEGARVLPIVYTRNSDNLHRGIFDPWLHIATYDWLRRPTTAFPNILQSPLMPVSIPADSAAPAPPPYRPTQFDWDAHGSHYDYFLLCGPSKATLAQFSARADLLWVSGEWVLFGRRN